MNIYVFASRNATNIWAGIGAGLWAVSKRDERGMKELRTKAQGMPVGALGLIYWSATQVFTTPFIIGSRAMYDQVVSDVWPEEWVMPFRIIALGTPRRLFPKKRAIDELSVFQEEGTRNIARVFRLGPTQVFVPTSLPDQDWAILFEALAS